MSTPTRTILRTAKFIRLPNTLKAKVGAGGLSEEILDQAERIIAENQIDFVPMGQRYLEMLMSAIRKAESAGGDGNQNQVIYGLILPAIQLKANGGMFHYPLVTVMADHLVDFLEVIERADAEALEIVLAFHTTIGLVLSGRLRGDGGEEGRRLLSALDEACARYYGKHAQA